MARTFVRASSQALHNATAIVTAAPFSVSLWAQTADISHGFQTLFSAIESGGVGRGFFVHILGTGSGSTDGTIRVRHDSVTGTGTALSSAQVANNTWFHAAAVFAGLSSRSVYLNGTKVTNTTICVGITIVEVNFGYYNAAFGDYLDGVMGEAAIWDVAITDDEVTSLSQGCHPRLVRPASLNNYWPVAGLASPEPGFRGDSTTTLSLVGSPAQAAHPRIYR